MSKGNLRRQAHLRALPYEGATGEYERDRHFPPTAGDEPGEEITAPFLSSILSTLSDYPWENLVGRLVTLSSPYVLY